MYAFNTAALLLFPGLGLAALAIGLLARRYSASALTVGLTGLLALTTASTWITTAGPVGGPQVGKPETVKPKEKTGNQEGGPDDASKRGPEPATKSEPELKQALAEKMQLTATLQAEQNKRADAERAGREAERTAAAAAARAAELEAKVREAQHSKAEAEREARRLQDELTKVRPAPPPPIPPDPGGIRRKLVEGDRRHYTTRDEHDLLPGREGAWYVVRLLKDGATWEFADRQFVLADATEINASAARLRDDVLHPLSELKKPWWLYVRGYADARRVTGPTGREVSYLPRAAGNTHSPEARGKRVVVPVQIDDLPMLGADWLREIVRTVIAAAGADEIAILENPPQQTHGRTAELVLFVAW